LEFTTALPAVMNPNPKNTASDGYLEGWLDIVLWLITIWL